MNNDMLLDFRQCVTEQHLSVYGIVVKQHGETVATHRWRSDDFVQVYSVSKSFTSVAVGIAISEGLFGINDLIIDLFSDKAPQNPNEYLQKLEVRHLLMMCTGQKEDPLLVHYIQPPFYEDWEKRFFQIEFIEEPGTHFMYNNGATYMLSSLIQRKTGMKLRDYLMDRLFTPLGIFNPQWDSCPRGVNKGYIGLHLTTEQLSRFTELLLNKGNHKGKQLIPKEYIEEASKLQIANPFNWDHIEVQSGYGYQFWRNSVPNSYRMDGLYGQFGIVLPDYDATVTITSHNDFCQNNLLTLVWNTILPKLK